MVVFLQAQTAFVGRTFSYFCLWML